MRRALADTAAGSAAVVLLSGAGGGKPVFARSTVDLAGSLGFQVLSGACLSGESGVPLAPVVEALRPVLSTDPERLGASGTALSGLLGGAGEPAIPPGQLLELLLAALGH